MDKNTELKFESPTFFKRIKGMLSVDFYRLFHTPLFYIFIAIAAIIPAMILGTSGIENPNSTVPVQKLFTNTWQMVASTDALYVVKNIGEYANMNMVFIFGGIMVSIFIGHDYRSGYVKQLLTTHSKKSDYMMSKTIICAFAMVCMCITYLFGTILAGLLVRASFDVNFGSLICAILGKIIMSLGWASLYTFLNVVLRKYFGVSIALSFFLGTGILIIGAAAVVGSSPILNIFLYGASVYACLSANFVSVLVCLLCSVTWTVIYNVLGTVILNNSDIY